MSKGANSIAQTTSQRVVNGPALSEHSDLQANDEGDVPQLNGVPRKILQSGPVNLPPQPLTQIYNTLDEARQAVQKVAIPQGYAVIVEKYIFDRRPRRSPQRDPGIARATLRRPAGSKKPTMPRIPATLKTPTVSKEPLNSTEGFDQETLRDFELWLTSKKGRPTVDPDRHSRIRTVLKPDWEPFRQDELGVDKSSRHIKHEHTVKWRTRRDFSLDNKDQVIRNPEGEFGPRIVASTWDIANYIITRHQELHHAGSKKTFTSLQRDVYGIRRSDVEFLTRRCKVCAHNQESPHEPTQEN